MLRIAGFWQARSGEARCCSLLLLPHAVAKAFPEPSVRAEEAQAHCHS